MAGEAGSALREPAGGPEGEARPSRTAPNRRARARPRETAQRGGGGFRDPGSLGERPQAPWHPLPLSELLILIGAIGTAFGLIRGTSGGAPVLFAGLAAVVIGTVEVTLREHLSGYRSHSLILALAPTIVFYTAVILIVAAFTPVPRALKVALLVPDVALFALVFKLLRARFLDARRERTFARKR